MRRVKKRMNKGEACAIFIMGIIWGTVFIFGNSYWNKTIEPDEAIEANVSYSSHKELVRLLEKYIDSRRQRGIQMNFSDYDSLYIDSACVNEMLRKQLDELERGTKMQILIHPNADTILDMRTSDNTILEFNDVMGKLEKEKYGFYLLGVFGYFSAVIGMTRFLEDSRIVIEWKRRKKEKIAIEKKSARKEIFITEEQKLKKMSRKQRKEYSQKKNK